MFSLSASLLLQYGRSIVAGVFAGRKDERDEMLTPGRARGVTGDRRALTTGRGRSLRCPQREPGEGVETWTPRKQEVFHLLMREFEEVWLLSAVRLLSEP